MKKSFYTFGVAGLLIAGMALLVPRPSFASIYENIKRITDAEFMKQEVERPLRRYIPKVYQVKPPISSDAINASVKELPSEACDNRTFNTGGCSVFMGEIVDIAKNEERVRTLGRDLQLIASGYEMPLTEHPSRILSIAPRMPSIIGLWQADSDWMFTPVQERRIRAMNYPDSASSFFGDLEALLIEMSSNPETFAAAIWRYKRGFFDVSYRDLDSSICKPQMEEGDGTELQYLKTRWCDLENVLQSLYYAISDGVILDPPVQHGETILFPGYLLPSVGIIVWVRIDGNGARSDIGLDWEFPIEPVLPSLDCSSFSGESPSCVSTAILGGSYPVLPQEPRGTAPLCVSPFGSQGYLCRPLETKDCFENEEEASFGDPETGTGIILTRCKSQNIKGITEQTYSGADACRIGGWRLDKPTIDGEFVDDTTDFDEETINKPYDCSNCAVDMYCDGNGPQRCNEGFALTFPKQSNGIIGICIPEEMNIPVGYFVHHELIHAQQLCGIPVGMDISSGLENCCAVERPAYAATCNAMADDGVFEGTDITLEICTSVLTNNSCASTGQRCSETENADVLEQYRQRINELAQRNPGNVATTCESALEAINNGTDVRTQQNLNSLQNSCGLGCSNKPAFLNTIGNNACYVAQCIEESIETQRLLPGRMPLIAGDQKYPWDAESDPDPYAGSLLPIPPIPLTEFPPYRPALLVRDLDLALCQQHGLPLLSPPQVCAFEAVRQFSLPRSSISKTGISFLEQLEESARLATGLENMAEGIGTRLGAGLYSSYMSQAGRTFADLVEAANHLLSSVVDVDFPEAMCPRYDGP